MYFKLAVQPNIFRRRSNHHPKHSRLDYKLHAPVPQGQVAIDQLKANGLCFTGSQVYPLKATQILLIGGHTADKIPRVELHYFVALARSAVAHIDGDCHLAPLPRSQRSDTQIAVSEGGIT